MFDVSLKNLGLRVLHSRFGRKRKRFEKYPVSFIFISHLYTGFYLIFHKRFREKNRLHKGTEQENDAKFLRNRQLAAKIDTYHIRRLSLIG